MNLRVRLAGVLMAAVLCVSMSGCLPSDRGQFEEEKEAHYQAGRMAVKSMDYPGGVEEYEKAVEVNPRNASAHFQLGWLYEEKAPDPAAAIYHYQRYLKLRPGADNAEVVQQHINNCRQDLAKAVLPLPVAPGLQRDLQQLVAENRRLLEENGKWKAYFASVTVQTASNSPSATQSTQRATATQSQPSARGGTRDASSAAARTHVVQHGDTLMTISRKYGVKLQDLLNANPGLDPRKLRVGKSVNIPRS